MAEEKKMSKGQRRYSNPPKIKQKSGDENKSAKTAEASAKAKSTSDGKSAAMDKGDGAAPIASDAAGTEGIPVHERHLGEREAMMKRHNKERHQMNSRHESEIGDMAKMHSEQMSSIAAP